MHLLKPFVNKYMIETEQHYKYKLGRQIKAGREKKLLCNSN